MKWTRTIVALLSLAAFGAAWTQQPREAQPEAEQVQPRFIWGFLVNIALSRLGSFVWDVFKGWLEARIVTGLESATDRVIANALGSSGARIRPRSTQALSARAADVVVGSPDTALKIEGTNENYQGVHLALMVAEPDGKTFVFRAVNQGFATGERFKLRVVSTFNGEMTIENINPRGERRQIYPPLPEQVVVLVAGKETLVPLGVEEYFEFTRATGREQLVVNLADPRAVGAAASRNKVFRQDVRYGSNFVQEVAPDTFAHISQPVELEHQAR